MAPSLASRKAELLEAPVVLLKAVASPGRRERPIRVGRAAFFRKPVDDRAPFDASDRALARRRGAGVA